MNAAVGLGDRIAEVCVLAQIRLHDPGNRMTEHPMLCNQHQRAVLDLLQQVGDTVRAMDFDVAVLLIDARFIAYRAESREPAVPAPARRRRRGGLARLLASAHPLAQAHGGIMQLSKADSGLIVVPPSGVFMCNGPTSDAGASAV